MIPRPSPAPARIWPHPPQPQVHNPYYGYRLGLVALQGADKGIFVTSGEFTGPALEEFRSVPWIELVDGTKLAARVKQLHPQFQDRATTSNQPLNRVVESLMERVEKEPHFLRVHECKLCNSTMVLRSNKDGPFWACSGFPKTGCPYTQKLSPSEHRILNPKGIGSRGPGASRVSH